jgi:hypothetical protein
MRLGGALSAAFASAALASAACTGAPAQSQRHVVAHSIAGCKVSDQATLLVTALGDFGSSRATGTVGAKSSATLDLPPELLGIEAEVLPRGFRGVGYADPPADVAFTLWSSDEACDATAADISPSIGGQALTAFDGGRGLFVAGLMPEPEMGVRNQAAYALSFDVSAGAPAPGIALSGLPRPRAFASATAFGTGVLVAGGIDPNVPSDPRDDLVADTALVLSSGQFENGAIELGDARAHHGAVELANGQTLLVGGIGRGPSEVLSSMEAVDPLTHNSRFFQVAGLAHPRRDPVVLRLANDDVFVAGGTDANQSPVGTVEWFGADGSPCARPSCTAELVPLFDRAFVALPSGAVLTTGGVDPVRGEPARAVAWIRPDGQVDQLEPLSSAQRGSGKLRLVAGADGGAWLFNGLEWWKFDPWQAVFVVPEVAPSDGPDGDMPGPVALDPGLFVWLARDVPGDARSPARVRGFRHGVRGAYTRDAGLMLLSDAEHWVADRPPRSGGDVPSWRSAMWWLAMGLASGLRRTAVRSPLPAVVHRSTSTSAGSIAGATVPRAMSPLCFAHQMLGAQSL